MEKYTLEQIEKYKKMSFGELVDSGICPHCFDKQINGEYFGDSAQLLIYEDADIECSFVPNPRANGHMMIASAEHYHDMSEAPDHINEKIIRYAKRLMNAIKELYGSERVYLCTMSDGPMNHYHVQLIPRYPHEERGSKNFVKPRKEYVYDEEKLLKLKQILENFEK